jgi:hypothetical protein
MKLFRNNLCRFAPTLLSLWWGAAIAAAPATINGQLSQPGERDEFTFRVEGEKTFYFDSLKQDAQLHWSLNGPRGLLVEQRSFDQSDSFRIGVAHVLLPLVPGDYTLTVSASGGATPDYAFRWHDLADATLLTPGASITASLNPARTTALYQFAALAGDQVRLNVTAQTNFSGRLRLFGPGGQPLIDNGAVSSPVLNLPRSGNHTLLLEGDVYATGTSTVVFDVESLGNVPPVPPTGTALALDETVSGSLAAANTTNFYTLTVATPTRLVMDALEPASGVFWSLVGPDGRLVDRRSFQSSDGLSGTSLRQLSPGLHQLQIAGAAGVNYNFRLLDLAGAAELVPGTPTALTFANHRQTQLYRFNAAAGSRWFYHFLNGDLSGSTSLRLVDPFGAIAYESNARDQFGPFTLNLTGPWTVLLEGYIFETPAARTLEFNLLPVTDGAQAMALGAPVAGTVTSPGQTQRHTFSLATTQSLFFDSLAPAPNLNWSLTGPGGPKVERQTFQNDDTSLAASLRNLPAGDYTLAVNGYREGTNGYQFRLLNLATATEIQANNSITGELNPGSEARLYRFTAPAGTVMFFDALLANTRNANWLLRDRFDRQLFYNGLSQDQLLTLDAGGEYQLWVNGYSYEAAPVPFSFALRPVTDTSEAISLETTVTRSLASPGQTRRFTFTLNTARRLHFDALTPTANARWRLDGPAGQASDWRAFTSSDWLNNVSALNLSPGAYVLAVNASGDDLPEFSFRLLDLAAATPITLDETVAGELDPPTSTRLYRFDATAGSQLYCDTITAGSQVRSAAWRLLDPQGTLLFGSGLSSDQFVTLPHTGSYTLLLEGYPYETQRPSFTFRLFPVLDGTHPLALDTTVNGTLAVPGQKQTHTFTLPTPTRVYFDALSPASGLVWSLDGPTGQVVPSQSFTGSDGANGFTLRTLPAGDYQLTVDGNGDARGDYRFRLVNLNSATPLNFGTEIIGQLDPFNRTDSFQFTANAGDRMLFDSTTPTPRNAYWRLVGPTSDLVFNLYLGTDSSVLTLATTGTYTLFIEGYVQETAAVDYRFQVVPQGNSPLTPLAGTPLTLGTVVEGTLADAAATTNYVFTLATPTTVHFDSLRLNPPRATLQRRDDGGATIRPFTGVSLDQLDYAFSSLGVLRLPPGDYQLTLGNQAGDYRFRVLNADAAPLLVPGTETRGTNTPALASGLYRLNAQAGDEYYLSGGPTTGFTTTVYGSLWRPDGQRTSLADLQLSSDHDVFRLPVSGSYYWLVSAQANEASSEGSFRFNFIPVTHPTNTFALGETVHSQIASAGQTRYFRFQVPTPTVVSFDALSNTDSLLVSLDGPNGNLFINRDFGSTDYYLTATARNLIVPAGDYQLSFSAHRELTPTFSFRVLDTATAISLIPGVTHTGTNAVAASTELLAFTATAGDTFYLRTERGTGWVRTPLVTLHAPSGTVVANFTLGRDVDTFTLQETGRHLLTVISASDETATNGVFKLTFIPVVDTAVNLGLGEIQTGEITSPGQSYRYAFSLAEPKRLHFDVLGGAGSFEVKLTGPAGEQALNYGDYYLGTPWLNLVEGSYELTVRRRNDETGPFSFRLLDFAAATPFTPGESVVTAFTPATATAIRSFNGTWGQRFYFDGQGYTGNGQQPLFQMVSPAGKSILRIGAHSDFNTFTLAESGTYHVLVLGEPSNPAASGTATFRLAPNLENPPSPLFEGATTPDLVVTAVTANPATGATTGATLAVEWIVRNAGDAPVNRSFTDRIALRHSTTGALLDTRLLFYDFALDGPLAPGTTRTRAATLRIPDGPVAVGSLEVTVTTDTLNNVPEGNEFGTAEANNQTTSAPLVVELAPYPDLRVTHLTATPPGEWIPGSTVSLTWITTNAGPAPAVAPWSEQLVVRNLTAGRVVANLSTNFVTSLASLGSEARSVSFSLPNSSDAYGQFELSVTTDADETIFEHFVGLDAETNNAAHLSVLNEAPTLTLDLPNTRLTEGQTVTATVARRPVGASALLVQLTSSDENQFTVPGTVVIPAGQASVTVTATAVDDAFVERTNTYVLLARSAGFRDAALTLTVEDNDRPVVTLSLAAATISEGAGPNATSATVTRSPVSARALTLGLTSANPNAARVPASVTIPANQAAVSFPVAAVENLTVDGPRSVALGGSVLDAFTSQALYEIVPALLAVTDNDGPTLTLRIAADLVGEGRSPATTATVTRNTAPTGPLVVSLSSSDPTEATVPLTVTLPSGETSVSFPITSLNDGVTDGNQTVTVTATADTFTAGSDTLVVSDADLPDLVVNFISFPANGITDGNLAINFRLENRGLRDGTTAVTQRVFLSADNLAGNDTLVSQVVFDGPLPVGQTVGQTVNIRLPANPGSFYVVVQADATGAMTEALENNNLLVSATTVTTAPAYSATVSTDVTTALAGTPVPLRGHASRGDGALAAAEHVTVHIEVRGTHRTLEVVTDANGDFTTTFQPLPKEAGHYRIAAAYPGLPMPAAQDEFSLLGLDLVSPGSVTVTEGTAYDGTTRIRNLSDVPLTGLTVEVLEFDPSLNVTAQLETNRLAGDAEIPLHYTITPVNRTTVQSGVKLRVTSAEGATEVEVFTVRQEFLRPALVTAPGRLTSTMLRGAQTVVAFDVINQGGLATGPLEVLLPNLPWLSVSSPAVMDPLAPGARTSVTLLLTPAADLALGDYPGQLVLSGGNTALTLPFEFRALSDNRGNLRLTAEDEYTYFAAGGPKVTNALVVLTDALSGVPVRTNVTDSDGTALFTNLLEAQYVVHVKADQHGPFRQTAFVPAAGTTNVVAFLPRETVRYTFTVSPTTVEDRYAFTVESTFETQVPIPVVTITPASLDIANYPEDEFQVDYTIANHGLIAAQNVRFNAATGGQIEMHPLITDLGRLEANSSITIPVRIKRVRPPIARADFNTGQCSVTAGMLWDYLCGPNVVNKETATYTFDSTGCDLVDLYRQVYNVVPDPATGPPSPNNHPCQDPATFFDCLDQFQPVSGFEPPPGFKFECKTTRPANSIGAARAGHPRPSAEPSNEVCAKVKLKLDQRAVLTRDAFNALLEIDNDTTSPIENILVTLNLTAEDGSNAIAQFGLREPVLAGLSAVNGTGVIQPKTLGSASWILIPTLDAAPTNGVALFLVGGTLSYSQDGADLTIPLAPAPIQVYPQPELLVRYFHQRDVFADDPFTPEIEPSQPYSLAVQILNQGYGAVRNLKLAGGKPQIVDNEKGLLIEFKTVGTQLENQALTPALDVDFGEIGTGTNKTARWLFTSSIQGSFTDYHAAFEHLDALGTKRLSLVKGVEIHELVRLVNADRTFDDARLDFLLSRTNDPDHLPYALYLSDGRTNAVTAHTNAGVSGVLSAGNRQVTLTASLGAGWSYLRVPDPAGDQPFTLRQVLRADGSEIAFGTNAWTTDRSFRGGDLRPSVTNLVHLLDYDSAGTYTLVYEARSVVTPDLTAPVSRVDALPAASGATFAVTWSGTDDRGPVSYYDLFVSVDGGPYSAFLNHTALTGTVYTGAANRRYAFYSVATDAAGNSEAAPATADAETTVSILNRPPVLAFSGDVTVDEGNAANAQPTASDPDGDALAFELLSGAPAGALINPTTGFVTWSTSESDGPSTHIISVRVTDYGTPALSATNEFRVFVREVNDAPTLAPIADAVLSENTWFTLQLAGADADQPAQELTYGLAAGAPQGLVVDPDSGELRWRPRASQGPSTNQITVTLTDSGLPPRSVQRTATFYVRDTAAELAVTAGRTNVLAGESSFVPLHLAAGPDLDGLSFSLGGDPLRLTDLALANLAGDVTSVQVVAAAAGGTELRFTLTGGSLSANRPLAEVTFTTPAEAPSGVVPLAFTDLTGTAGARVITRTSSAPGRVIVVNQDAVLDLTTDALTPLHLYGRPGLTYRIEHSPGLGAEAVWTPVRTVTADERIERLPADEPGPLGFLRAWRE